MGSTGDRVPLGTPQGVGTPVLEGFDGIEMIAAGGDSTIYRAHQTSLDREVAIKVVTLSGQEELRRFQREIALTVRLGRAHPNIVTVLDTRTLPDGRPCIVMDLFELGSVHDRLRATGPFDPDDVVTVGRVIADALAFAHSQRVVHRDVKPQNILILPTSYVLADFGIARLVDAGHTASLDRLSYRHASPEVLDGHVPEPVDDLWSLCSTLATLVEGRAPFAADEAADDTALAYLRRVRVGERRPLPASVPADLAAVIDRGMHADRAARYCEAQELLADLRALESGSNRWGPPPAGDAVPVSASAAAPPAADRDDAATAPRRRDPAGPPSDPTDIPSDSEERQWAPQAAPQSVREPVPTRLPDPAPPAPSVAARTLRSEAPARPEPPGAPAGDAEADALPTGMHPSADVGPGGAAPTGSDAAPDPAAPAGTPPRVRARVVVVAAVLLVGSAVIAYFLAKPSAPAAEHQPQRTISGTAAGPSVTGAAATEGLSLANPQYVPTVLGIRFADGLMTVTVRAPEADTFSYILFDASDSDPQTRQGLIPLTDLVEPGDDRDSEITVPIPRQRCGATITVAVIATSAFDRSQSGIAFSHAQRVPDC